MDLEALSLETIIGNHVEVASEITRKAVIIPLFERYLREGYFPYYKSEHSGYYQRLIETVNKVLDSDLPAVEEVTIGTIRKTKKMLAVLAASCPQQPNMSKLYAELETDRNQGLKMLSILERAGLVATVMSGREALKNLSRPEKIYCANSNLMHAMVSNPNAGTIRETFFVNQLRSMGHAVNCPEQGDFLVDGSLLFEVGGEKKRFTQIKDIPSSYVVSDNLEVGYGNRIPLWLFGFLY